MSRRYRRILLKRLRLMQRPVGAQEVELAQTLSPLTIFLFSLLIPFHHP